MVSNSVVSWTSITAISLFHRTYSFPFFWHLATWQVAILFCCFLSPNSSSHAHLLLCLLPYDEYQSDSLKLYWSCLALPPRPHALMANPPPAGVWGSAGRLLDSTLCLRRLLSEPQPLYSASFILDCDNIAALCAICTLSQNFPGSTRILQFFYFVLYYTS